MVGRYIPRRLPGGPYSSRLRNRIRIAEGVRLTIRSLPLYFRLFVGNLPLTAFTSFYRAYIARL